MIPYTYTKFYRDEFEMNNTVSLLKKYSSDKRYNSTVVHNKLLHCTCKCTLPVTIQNASPNLFEMDFHNAL